MSAPIEQVYDAHVAAERLKSGTKYERLAALVFQVLDRSQLVVHDLVLRAAGKEAAHQIDVTASTPDGKSRRIVVEARDRQTRVTLGQVRDFFGVVHQIQPDAAWIVSPVGFTPPAIRFARDEGIGLAELRAATPADDNRVKAIHVRGSMRLRCDPIITWRAANAGERERANQLLASHTGDVQLVGTDSEVRDLAGHSVGRLEEVLSPIFDSLELSVGVNEGEWRFPSVLNVDVAGVRVDVKGFEYSVEVVEAHRQFTIGNPDSVASLIIQSVEDTAPNMLDRVIYDKDLQALAFDTEGRVIRRRPRRA